MDIEDKLKLLKKERRTRGRSQQIQETWRKIGAGGEDLTVKEKLERLISLSRREKGPEESPGPTELETFGREPIHFYENSYILGARYGQIPLSMGLEIPGKVLSFLSRNEAFEALTLESALFLDLETTGLSGGTGTVPFLVGMGYYKDDSFNVAQYFLAEMAEEERMVRELSQFFREGRFKSIVTYNGKAFDIPILETRFVLHREPFPLRGIPHLDFLFSARGLWKHKYESCRLFHLAREIVRAERDEDIPGAEIPLRYFQYIRTGDFSLIEPILYHNREDILSLLGVVAAGALLLGRGQEKTDVLNVDAIDLVGIGRLYESAGETEKSVELFERALQGVLKGDVSLTIQKKLSGHFKRSRAWDKAVPLWKGMSELNQIDSYRELAIYYEHKEKRLEEAVKSAEEGLALSLGVSLRHEQDFRKRLERLRGKIRRRKLKTTP